MIILVHKTSKKKYQGQIVLGADGAKFFVLWNGLTWSARPLQHYVPELLYVS